MKIGDLAPDFVLRDHRNEEFCLGEELRRGPVVLFFYPAAMSMMCSKESCHFRDLGAEFNAFSAQRVGISMDGTQRQNKFAQRSDLDYPLLSDVDGKVASLYGVKRVLDVLRVRRTTFVIDVDQRVIEKVSSELAMQTHADRALAALAGDASQT